MTSHHWRTRAGSGTEYKVELTSTMVKCCAYQLSRSAGRILFGYQNSTNPGSDQLAVPTKILPPSFDSDAFATTSQTKSRRQRTQIRFSEIDCLNCDDTERSR